MNIFISILLNVIFISTSLKVDLSAKLIQIIIFSVSFVIPL